jgi:hypothetical protein
LCISLEAILLIKNRWSKGHSRIKAYKPQDPRIPKRERIMMATRGMAQHRIIQKE